MNLLQDLPSFQFEGLSNGGPDSMMSVIPQQRIITYNFHISKSINTGVPQGSGPVLFLLNIIDLPGRIADNGDLLLLTNDVGQLVWKRAFWGHVPKNADYWEAAGHK